MKKKEEEEEKWKSDSMVVVVVGAATEPRLDMVTSSVFCCYDKILHSE